MTFRDDRQRGQVCWMLCSWIPTSPWELTETGYRPTRYGNAAKLGRSSGEEAMVKFARALWGGDDLVIFLGWDGERMRSVASLLVAMSASLDPDMHIDEWLRAQAAAKPGQRF